jgi:pimeloyl-ACP methyl ester carboxylesterase
MSTESLSFRASVISYSCQGTGPRILFAFHGYGESARSFSLLAEPLGTDFTLIAIDLPYHGLTKWNEGYSFDPRHLASLMAEIASLLPGRKDSWYLLGYSMGGRIALQLQQLIPERIGKLILLAPDGLKMNPWYWLATQTGPGRRLFGFTMSHPAWFFSLLSMANRLKLVNPGIYKFTTRYIDDPIVRRDLYIRWTTMRRFRPDLSVIRSSVQTRHLPVRLVYGRYDRIIRWETGERFCTRLEPNCRLLILPSGHQLLQPAHLEPLLSAITT